MHSARVEPTSCDQGRCKNDALPSHSAAAQNIQVGIGSRSFIVGMLRRWKAS